MEKPSLAFTDCGQAPEELVRGLQGRPARLADEVAVGQGSQLVGGGAVPKVGVDDDAELLEVLQVAVDGRDVDLGRPRLYRLGQVLGTAVLARLEEHLQQGPA